jgi:small ligand-binding sensory domain FIST
MTTAAGVGLSIETDPVTAARQAARAALGKAGVDRADWGMVFATGAHRPRYAALLAAVQGTLGTERIVGCSAWGVLAGGEEVEGRPAVAVMAVRSDRIEATTLLAPIGDDQGPAAAVEIGRRLGGDPRAAGGEAPGALVLLPDPLALRPDLFLNALAREVPGAPAIGAAASGDPKIEGTFQFCGRNVATRSLAALALSGDLEISVGITQGCQPLGEPCRITRGGSNLILELDGRPALEVLRSRLPAPLRDSLERLGGHLFVGLPPDPDQARIEPGEYLVRNLIGADPARGALAIGTTIKEGQPILLVLREGQAARDDLKQVLARLSAAPARPRYRFGFYFNCAARGRSLYGMPGIDAAYISGALDNLPIIGFFGNAEIAPLRGANHLFTHTGVLALVAERT